MSRLLRNASWVYAAQAVNGLLGVAFVPFAVARLGSEGYGLYGAYTVLLGYAVLADVGVGKNLLRRLAAHRSADCEVREIRTAVGTYVVLCSLLLIAVTPLLVRESGTLFPVPPRHLSALRWVVALSIADYVLGVPVSVRQTFAMAAERFDRYARLAVVSGLGRYALGFAAVASFGDPVALVAALVARRPIEWIVAPWILGRLPAGAWRPAFSLSAIRWRLGEAAVLSLAQVLQLTVVSGGAFVVTWTLGLAALGVYRAVFDLVSKIWLFSNVVGLVVFPRFVSMVGTPAERRRLVSVLPAVLTASLGLFGCFAMSGAVVGPTVLPVMGLTGSSYVPLFVLMAGGLAFNAHTNLSWELAQAAGWYKQVARLAAMSLICMAAVWAAAWLARPQVAIGWAWLLGQVPAVMLTDALGLRAVGAPTWTPYQRAARLIVLLATTGLAVATVEAGPRLVAQLLLGVGVLGAAASLRSVWGLRGLVLGEAAT